MEMSSQRKLRPRQDRNGFTLIEIVVYCGIASLVLGIIVSMFKIAGRTQQQTYSQYLVGGSLASTIRLLRNELQSTALASIKAHPEAGGTAPGLSCVSAFDKDGKFTVNGYGVPLWQKHVFYHLGSDGSLSRWQQPIQDPNMLPAPSATLPSQLGSDGRSVMSGLLPPNKAAASYYPSTKFGGFEINFVRRTNGDDSLSQVNPADSKDYATHTRLVQVTLRTFEERSEPDFSEISFRVCPRY